VNISDCIRESGVNLGSFICEPQESNAGGVADFFLQEKSSELSAFISASRFDNVEVKNVR
jgi:hypothetical protein